MTTEKLLYTDGHKITVTESTFRVANTLYHLEGIIRHDFKVIAPRRIPVLVSISAGLAFLTLGVFNLVPMNVIPNLMIDSYELTARFLSLIFGGAMLLAGVVFFVIEKEKYGVQIVTAEGEKDVVVSKRREYVTMIDEALTKAMERWKF